MHFTSAHRTSVMRVKVRNLSMAVTQTKVHTKFQSRTLLSWQQHPDRRCSVWATGGTLYLASHGRSYIIHILLQAIMSASTQPKANDNNLNTASSLLYDLQQAIWKHKHFLEAAFSEEITHFLWHPATIAVPLLMSAPWVSPVKKLKRKYNSSLVQNYTNILKLWVCRLVHNVLYNHIFNKY